MRIVSTLVATVMLLAAGAAHAQVRDCSEAEFNAAKQNAAFDDDDDHQLFSVPDIVYARPEFAPNFRILVVVDRDGSVVCLDNRENYARKNSALSPQRQALLDSVPGWRFKPFVKNGKPVVALTYVYVPERIVFDYHEDMPPAAPEQIRIRFENYACMGVCPAYTVTVSGDGHAVYEGSSYVDMPGRHSYAVPAADVSALIARLRAKDIWSMAGVWQAPVVDAGGQAFSLTIGDQTRDFSDIMGETIGMPHAVTEAEADIETVLGGERWVNLSDAAVAQLESEHFPFKSQAGADLLARAVSNADNPDDTAMLRLIALGAPLEGGHQNLPDDMRGNEGAPPLIFAAAANHRDILIDPLVQSGQLKTRGATDRTKVDAAFRAAIGSGRMSTVEKIWDAADDGSHPALTFSRDANDDAMSPRGKKRFPVSLLLDGLNHDGGWQGLEIVKWLVAHGCNIGIHNENGQDLLETAAQANDARLVDYLLSLGVPVRPDANALEITDDEDVALKLIAAGADPRALDNSFMTKVKSSQWTRVEAWLNAHPAR